MSQHDAKGLHHYHLRKRIHEKHEKYPHPNKWKRLMDDSVYLVAIFGPLMTLPQILNIWIDKNASGVSIVTWGGYLLGALFWLAYGIMHKEKPIIFTYTVWIVLYSIVVLGIVLFG